MNLKIINCFYENIQIEELFNCFIFNKLNIYHHQYFQYMIYFNLNLYIISISIKIIISKA